MDKSLMFDFALALGCVVLFFLGCYLAARFSIFAAELICELIEETASRSYERDKKKWAEKK
jgi:lipoprotein